MVRLVPPVNRKFDIFVLDPARLAVGNVLGLVTADCGVILVFHSQAESLEVNHE